MLIIYLYILIVANIVVGAFLFLASLLLLATYNKLKEADKCNQ